MNNYFYGGYSDAGYRREINEDYLSALELDDSALLIIVADGAGSKPSGLQPAAIAANEINAVIRRLYAEDPGLLLDNAGLFLSEAMQTANRVLGAFARANEEMYAGFGSSVTCCLLWNGGHYAFAHTGDTRLYMLKMGRDGLYTMHQLTEDHTKARKLLDDGLVTPEQYHTHPDRLALTGGLGVSIDPEIQTYEDEIGVHDFLLMTTDGIHYAIRAQPISEIVIKSDTCEAASKNLVEAAKSEKYADNMSALTIWRKE